METRPFVYVVATYLLSATLVAGPARAASGAVGPRRLRRAEGGAGAPDLRPGPPHEPAPGGRARSRGVVLLRPPRLPRPRDVAVARGVRPAAGDGDGAAAGRRPRRPRQRPPRGVARPRRRPADDRGDRAAGAARAAERARGGGLAVALVVSAVYFPAYWNKTGGLAQPARALRSMVAPDPRDALSDLYRRPGEREPQGQHPRERRDRQRVRRPDRATRCRSPTSAASTR